jgi:hypothetical protein
MNGMNRNGQQQPTTITIIIIIITAEHPGKWSQHN